MGYCMSSEGGEIHIKKENMRPLLETLSEFFKRGHLRWADGFDMEDVYPTEEELDDEECEPEETMSIEDVWDGLRYNIKETETDYIIDEFLGEKYGDDDKLFLLIAPYCEDGYLQMCGEDGEHFRFVIKDGKFEEVYAKLSWD